MIKICDIYFKKGKALQLFKLKLIKSGYTQEEAAKCLYACCPNELAYFYARNVVGIPKENIFKFNGDNKNHALYLQWLSETLGDMKFDYTIQNPPYNGTLHLSFLEKGLDILSENGKMVIIEPATWLINLNPNSTYVKGRKDNPTPEIKKRIEGHVESVIIENLNKNFETSTHVPFATTTIDMSKTFDTIKFVCCGEEKQVKSVYDCNLIGDYATVCGIIDKCQKFGNMMENHIWDEKNNDDRYITFMDICASPSNKNASSNATPESDTWFTESKNGDFFISYLGVSLHPKYEISNEPQYAFKACGNSAANKNYSDKHSTQLYGTRQELENWKHFIFNNKLPLFLNIALTIDQHNNSKPYLPWLVDKQYTDEEINELLGFTEEEIKLIDKTIKKYERNSPWFKRYMCGPGSVDSDPEKEEEIINNFIKSLDE